MNSPTCQKTAALPENDLRLELLCGTFFLLFLLCLPSPAPARTEVRPENPCMAPLTTLYSTAGLSSVSGLQEYALPVSPVRTQPAGLPGDAFSSANWQASHSPDMTDSTYQPQFSANINRNMLRKYRNQGYHYGEMGRLELARYYFQMALSVCNTEQERAVVRREIAVMENFIKLSR